MKRWTAVTRVDETERWLSWSRRLAEAGVANEFVPWDGPTEFSDLGVLDGYDFVRVGTSLSGHIIAGLKTQTTWTTLLGVIDGMSRSEHDWWPLCAMHEAFTQVIVELGQRLDNRASVLVAGAGAAAKVAVSALFKAGFKHFLLTDLDERHAMVTIDEVRRHLFGLSITWTPPDRIVTLSSDSSVVVNCASAQTGGKLLGELSYLNFLKRSGYVFDLNRRREPNVLVTEAREAGVGLMTGVEFAARTDCLWAAWAFGAELDLDRRRADLEPPPP